MYCERSISFNINTPFGLQRKVWFDLMFYSCRSGQENLRSMTKTTFDVQTDYSARTNIYQVSDEHA